MAKYFIGTQFNLSYGVTVHQVWMDTGFSLEYETTSKAKARAVCEYLNLKSEQDDLDRYRSEDTKGTIKPSSIKIS
jgi:hypothetical protein